MIIPEFEIEKGVLRKYRGREMHVIIPDGVTSIGSKAFDCYTPLVSVTIPRTVTAIGAHAFEGCERLTDIRLPSGLNTIGEGAFSVCKRLPEIHIPDGVLSIKAHTFDGCEMLREVTFPDNLISIGVSAFHWCKNLKTVTIPDSAFQFSQNMFSGCTKLKSISYRNISFNPNAYKNIDIPAVLDMICHKDFSRPMFSDIRTMIIFRMFLASPDDNQLRDYLTEHFSECFRQLIDAEETVLISDFLQFHGFLTRDNIDKWIRYAIDTRKIEIQVLLTNYKQEHIGYQSVEEIIQSKFAL